jgi:hypothetical protein
LLEFSGGARSGHRVVLPYCTQKLEQVVEYIFEIFIIDFITCYLEIFSWTGATAPAAAPPLLEFDSDSTNLFVTF